MKINIALMFGGKSVEHEISVISALQAYANIDKDKYNCIPIYIAKDSTMYSGADFAYIESYKNIPELLKKGQSVCMFRENGAVYLRSINGKRLFREKRIRIDVAFPIVHGLNVEDGTIQGFLHMLDLPYVGCDILSSSLGMDKYASKVLFKAHDIPVLDCIKVSRNDYYNDNEAVIKAVCSSLTYPVIVKPIDLGSSIGISIAHNPIEIASALELAFTFSGNVIIEPAVTDIQEINCSVLGDKYSAEASECEEPLNAGEILSYSDKYMSGSKSTKISTGSDGMASLQRRIPADISPELRDSIRAAAVKAFNVLGASGIVRIDFIVDKSKNKFYLNEVNTIPGSLAFYLWEPLGKKYTELLTELISIAMKAKRDSDELTTAFETNVLSMSNLSGAKK